MTDDAAQHPMEIVAALMEERQRYESWLTTLESRRESTPPHVYERVHADYGARLAGVMNQLAGRTTELRSAADSLRARIDRLQGDENAKRDERAEAELRAAVGEFAPDRWDALREASETEIEQLSRERSELAEEQNRLEELLRAAVAPRVEEAPPVPAGARSQSAAEVLAAVPPIAPPPAREEPPRDREPAAAAPAAPSADPVSAGNRAFDELAFLKSVTDGRDSGRTASKSDGDAPPARSSEAVAAPAGPAAEPRPRAMTPPAGQGIPRVPTPAAPSAVSLSDAPQPRSTAPARRMPTPPEPQRAPEAARQAPPPPAPRPTRGEEAARAETVARDNIPSFLRDVPNEQVKTLKCQECGTMNYPTEWYCERCGGELASM